MGRERISLPKDKMVRKLKIRTEPVLREVVDVVPSDNSDLSGWAVALIVIFVVLVVLTIVIVAYSCSRKKRCRGRGDVLVSGAAQNSQPAPSYVNPLSNADGHCNGAGEKRALDNAFNGDMKVPPCSGQAYPGSLPTEPLYASEMNKLESKYAGKAYRHALHSLGSCNNNSQLLDNLNQTYNSAQVESYPGILPAEVTAQKTAAALNANGWGATDSPNLSTAGEASQEPGMMAYGHSGNVNKGALETNAGELTNNAWALNPSEDLSLALPEDQAQIAENVWNLVSSMPATSLTSGSATDTIRKNNKAMIQCAQANPDVAAELLLNTGSIMQPTMASVQAAQRGRANFYPMDATPPTRLLNISSTALNRVALATPAAGITDQQFNLPVAYFEAARAAKCQ